MFVIPIILAK